MKNLMKSFRELSYFGLSGMNGGTAAALWSGSGTSTTDFKTGKKGYIFYDLEGDGKFTHIEYCKVDANGAVYSFYNNNGYKKDEKYYHRYFMKDNNAGAKTNSTGKLKFVALN